MNIWDLEVGDTGIGDDGTEYKIVGDSKERNAFVGIVPVRIAVDQHGKRHKFMRGIEVKLLHVGSASPLSPSHQPPEGE